MPEEPKVPVAPETVASDAEDTNTDTAPADDDDDPHDRPLPAPSFEELWELNAYLRTRWWRAHRAGLCPVLSDPGDPCVRYGIPEGHHPEGYWFEQVGDEEGALPPPDSPEGSGR